MRARSFVSIPALISLCLAVSVMACDVEPDAIAVDCEAATTELSYQVAQGPRSCCSLVAEVNGEAGSVVGFDIFCTNNTHGEDSPNVTYSVLDDASTSPGVVLSSGLTVVPFDDGFEVQQNSGAVVFAVRQDAASDTLAFPSQWRDGEELLVGQCTGEPQRQTPLVVDAATGQANPEDAATDVWPLIQNSIVPDALLFGASAYLSTPTVLRWEDESGTTRSFVVINAGFESCVQGIGSPAGS